MDSLAEWWTAFEESLTASLVGVGQFLPRLVAAIVVMFVGWLVARVLRALLLRSGGAVTVLLERAGRRVTFAGRQMSDRLTRLGSNFLFWIVILLFAAIAARVTGLDAFSGWLDRVIAYLPTLIAGILIALAGFLLGTLVRDVVAAAFVSVGSKGHELAGLAAQSAVFITALVIGLDQIGIDVTFLITLASVCVGGLLLSIALAFGLGSREFVGNLVAAHQLKQTLEEGDRLRIGDIEGKVLEITPTAVVLANEDGRLYVPARLLQEQTSTVVAGVVDE